VNGTTITNFNGVEIDLGKWTRLTMREAIREYWPEEAGAKPASNRLRVGAPVLQARLHAAMSSLEKAEGETRTQPGAHRGAEDHARRHHRDYYDSLKGAPLGKSVYNLFEAVVEPFLIQPTIIYDYPTEVSPLSKAKPDDPDARRALRVLLRRLRAGQRLQRVERSGGAAQALCPAA
jgi:lysyl-tRNA synthetase class 2